MIYVIASGIFLTDTVCTIAKALVRGAKLPVELLDFLLSLMLPQKPHAKH